MATSSERYITLAKMEDVRVYAADIADSLNTRRELGILFLVDPIRTLDEIGYHVSPEFQDRVRRSVFGATRSQADQYDAIKERLAASEDRISGIRLVRFRCKMRREGNCHVEGGGWPTPEEETTVYPGGNPIGGYDTVMEVSEGIMEKIAQVTYDEGVYSHRVPIPAGFSALGSEVILGRPKSVSLDTQTANHIKIEIPFALVQVGKPKKGILMAETGLKIEAQAGKPAYLLADFNVFENIQVQSAELSDAEKGTFQMAMGLAIALQKVPLSPLIKEMSEIGLTLADLDYKTTNAAGAGLDSLSVGMDFSPNNNAGNIQNVLSFAKQDWAVGVHERFIKQKFYSWWDSAAAAQYKRLSKSKLENYKSLGSNFAQIFDPNGDIHLNSVNFSIQAGHLEFSVDITLEDAFWFFDADATISGKVLLGLNPANNKLTMTVTDVDVSVSCWSKFIIALFFAAIGLIGGAVIGGIVGGVIGGVLGASIGATIGASISSLATGVIVGLVIPALATAAVKGQLESLTDLELLTMTYDWQIPGTLLTLSVVARWLEVKAGEILVGGTITPPPLDNISLSLQQKTIFQTKTDVDVEASLKQQTSGKEGSCYTVDSEYNISVIIDQALEKPIACLWSVGGASLKGAGDQVKISIKTSLVHVLLPPPADSGFIYSADANKFTGVVATGAADFVPALKVEWSAQVLNSDGSKGTPYAFTGQALIPPKTLEMSDQLPIAVVATDALGASGQASLNLQVSLLGNYYLDILSTLDLGKYEAYADLDGIPPGPIVRTGLMVDRELPINPVGKIAFRHPGLVVNLLSEGVEPLVDAPLAKHAL